MTERPLQLFLDARTIREGMTGVGRYTMGLLHGLSQLGRQAPQGEGPIEIRAAVLPQSIELLETTPGLESVEWVAVDFDPESHPRADLALRFRLPRLVRPGEVYHGPAFLIPGGRQRFPRVVSIHDLGVFLRPGDFPRKFAIYLRWRIRRSLAVADLVLVPSRAVASEITSLLGVSPERMSVIPHAPSMGLPHAGESGAPPPDSTLIPSGPYFVSVGTLEPRKDPVTALEALTQLCRGRGDENSPSWLWIGAEGFRGHPILERLKSSPIADRFRHVGFQSEAAVAHAVERAVALVYPSRYEGFGLPPLEAMSIGVPVVASDLPVLRELCGDAALYFPPGDATALADRLRRILDEPGLEDRLRRLGRERSARFSWNRTAQATVTAYRQAAARRAAKAGASQEA